jgi:hypothetical protein
MKKFINLFLVAGLFVFAAGFILSSCTKEGPQGPAGANGTNGTNGTNAAATCQECHNFSDTIVAKIFQYNASKHATGSTILEAGSLTPSCSPCHTSQGFGQTVASGQFNANSTITDAAPINCRTCHQIHKTYTNADWSLATTAQYKWRFDSTQTQHFTANHGTANLCGRCHQARPASPALTNPTSNTDSISITSSRWGPHHGPQSNILAAIGAYPDATFGAYGTSPHKDTIGCMGCHGADAIGNYVGGHTLLMTSATTGDNITVCKTCHPSLTSFDFNGAQTTITVLYNQLKVKLATIGMLDSVNMVIKTGKYAQSDLAAYWNFMLVYADRSMGVHNYQYTHDILQAGINHFGTKNY